MFVFVSSDGPFSSHLEYKRNKSKGLLILPVSLRSIQVDKKEFKYLKNLVRWMVPVLLDSLSPDLKMINLRRVSSQSLISKGR